MGCVLLLQLPTNPEMFFVPRSGDTVTMCVLTENQPDAYLNITVVDRELNGSDGTVPFIILDPLVLETAELYTLMTGCDIIVPELTSTLSAGAIVGIVFAALIVGAVILVVIILLLVYRIRTGHWFKLREKDEEKLTVHFEKELLMGDIKPKKKSKVVIIVTTSHALHHIH
jgi:hypothetical protein